MEINKLYNGDSIQLIKELEDDSIHLILSDIPYGIGYEDWDVLHNNTNSAVLGTSKAQEKAGGVKKGEENLKMVGLKLIKKYPKNTKSGVKVGQKNGFEC